MYKALYSFSGKGWNDVVCFDSGCLFNLLEQVDDHWWYVATEKGDCGMVPASYLQLTQSSTSEVLASLDKSMFALRRGSGGSEDSVARRNLQKLALVRQTVSRGESLWKSSSDVVKTQKKGKSPKRHSAPLPPTQSSGAISQIYNIEVKDGTVFPPVQSKDTLVKSANDLSKVKAKQPVPNNLAKIIIDDLRASCAMSFQKAASALSCILHHTSKYSDDPVFKALIAQLNEEHLSFQRGGLVEEDLVQLQYVLDKLVTHKSDMQQRNWAIQDDYQEIQRLLKQLIQTMNDIDPSVCMDLLQRNDCRYVNELVVYFQMEPRSKLRVSLLNAFQCMCRLDRKFLSQMLCSVLPTELAATLTRSHDDTTLYMECARMVALLLSTGEPVPYHHYSQLNDDFVQFLLDGIEQPPDEDDELADSLLTLLLSFNKHFSALERNTIMQLLPQQNNWRVLTEKILLLVNKECDPVANLSGSSSCPDSVLKFLIDVFSSSDTSSIFYSNDMNVLIDIILRQITDRPSKDKVRTEYFSLFHMVLNTSSYRQQKRHCDQFKRIFDEILANKETESEVDVYIVTEVVNRFRKVFHP